MNDIIKILHIDAESGFYKMERFSTDRFIGPVDLGFYFSRKFNTTNFGIGQLAGSIIPGSNRLVFTGFSPCWTGFYVSTMGGAGLIFDNLGINFVTLRKRHREPAILVLNRDEGEEIEISLYPVPNVFQIWENYKNKKGVYALMEYIFDRYGSIYKKTPRILATGPASYATDFGAIASAVIKKDKITGVDTWAGRGGFGSRLVQEHNIVGIIYGGTFVDEDFQNKKLADEYFQKHYKKNMRIKDFEATKKYRFDPKFDTGGTFGVNFAKLGTNILYFNYNSLFDSKEDILKLNEDFILKHYLAQYNEEIIKNKKFYTCGEPCVAVCKKVWEDKYKKDYEPYQVLGPLSGIFDQRAAEEANHYADSAGFDGIAIGGVIAWIFEILDKGYMKPQDFGISGLPKFNKNGFEVVSDSRHNSSLVIELIDGILKRKENLDMMEGARILAKKLSKKYHPKIKDLLVYNAFGRRGWMIPNQYFTPGILSPMPIMGKYYQYYGFDFIPPYELGRTNAERMVNEIMIDNSGLCRFHRGWAEKIIPELMHDIFHLPYDFKDFHKKLAATINSRNASKFYESEKNIDFLYSFLKRKKDFDGIKEKELDKWIDYFRKDKTKAAFDFWFEILKGIHDYFREVI